MGNWKAFIPGAYAPAVGGGPKEAPEPPNLKLAPPSTAPLREPQPYAQHRTRALAPGLGQSSHQAARLGILVSPGLTNTATTHRETECHAHLHAAGLRQS